MKKAKIQLEIDGYSNDVNDKDARDFENRCRVFFGPRVKKDIDFRGAKTYFA
ncbi:hypothetical protein [Flavipsychrobacter stenotrophus]|uniref:hypothetical protein n=1 Tax=Flavipsychrobacter stenotrophus TaxID=2077091 RepID=UPI001374AFF6|nr:hypothetical protein [Flavipsychrobacter stenotrophus]